VTYCYKINIGSLLCKIDFIDLLARFRTGQPAPALQKSELQILRCVIVF